MNREEKNEATITTYIEASKQYDMEGLKSTFADNAKVRAPCTDHHFLPANQYLSELFNTQNDKTEIYWEIFKHHSLSRINLDLYHNPPGEDEFRTRHYMTLDEHGSISEMSVMLNPDPGTL